MIKEGTTLDGQKVKVDIDGQFLHRDYVKPLMLEELKTASIKRLLEEYRCLIIDIDSSTRPHLLPEYKMILEVEKEIIARATK